MKAFRRIKTALYPSFPWVRPVFSIEKGEVKMSDIDKKEKFLPTMSFNNGKLDVNVLWGNYSNIIVKLYDNEGRLVMSDKHYAEFKLN